MAERFRWHMGVAPWQLCRSSRPKQVMWAPISRRTLGEPKELVALFVGFGGVLVSLWKVKIIDLFGGLEHGPDDCSQVFFFSGFCCRFRRHARHSNKGWLSLIFQVVLPFYLHFSGSLVFLPMFFCLRKGVFHIRTPVVRSSVAVQQVISITDGQIFLETELFYKDPAEWWLVGWSAWLMKPS